MQLQRLVAGRDALGQPQPDQWENAYGTLAAEVRDLSGAELLRAQHEFGKVSSVVLMRYVSGVETGMRVVDVTPGGEARRYHVVVALADAKRRQLEVFCEHGVRQ